MKKQYLHGLIPILLLAVFAAALLSVLVSGAKIYRVISERDDAAFTRRTAVQYITVKVEQAVRTSEITTEVFGDSDAIILPMNIDGRTYITRLYYHDGNLCELFSAADAELGAADGEKILPIEAFSAEIEDGLLCVTVAPTDGDAVSFYLTLRGDEEAEI